MEMQPKINCLRVLTEDELDLVAGGTGSSVTVWGDPWSWSDFQSYFYMMTADWSGGVGGGGGGGDGGEEPPEPPEPDCSKVNPVTGIVPPDGAKYYAPESVTAATLMNVLNHLSDYSRNHTAASLLAEFNDMYSNPSNPYFIDFKDWGTAGGPTGSVSGGTSTYYSEAAGEWVTSSVFEPFGNWFYGFAGTWAGISPDVLYGAAALVQEGDTGWIPNDDPQDIPHISAGIRAAIAYSVNPSSFGGIEEGSCATGTSNQALGGSALYAQVDPERASDDPTYREDLWRYVENRYEMTV